MKAKEIESLESYFKTENEHWNGYAIEMLCEVLQQGQFEKPETPLQLFSKAIDIFIEQHKTPLKAVQDFGNDVEKENLNPAQKLFIYEWVHKYVNNSIFDKADTKALLGLLKSQIKRLKAEPKKDCNKPLTGNIRDTLKDMMQKELEQMPNTLKDLEPVQRLNIICKLIPFVLPKVESVSHSFDEPD